MSTSVGSSRRLAEDFPELHDLPASFEGKEDAMLAKSVAKENKIRALIKAAQDEKAEVDARVEAEKATLYGKAKAALLEILEPPKVWKPRHRARSAGCGVD